MNKTRFILVLVVALGISLSGCSGKEHTEEKGPVAVRVNGQPIMATAFGVRPKPDPSGALWFPVSASHMKTAVDLELLRQAAVEAELDQDEKIRAEIAEAPNEARKTLAAALINKHLSSSPAPTDADVSAYYNSNPLQFAQRKRYDLQTCVVRPVAGKESEIKAELAGSETFDDLERWLKANEIKHGCVSVSVDSARADETYLQKLANVPVGGGLAEEGKDWMSIIFVKAMNDESITLEQAKTQITKTLMDKKKAAAYDQMTKQLRDKAKIEYVPPYTENGMTKKALVTPGEKGQ